MLKHKEHRLNGDFADSQVKLEPVRQVSGKQTKLLWTQAKTFRKRRKKLTRETERNRDEVDTNTDRKFPLDLVQEF